MTFPPGMRRIDPDTEAAKLADERKQATKASQPHCRHCKATEARLLMWTADGWQCLDDVDCAGRQAERLTADE